MIESANNIFLDFLLYKKERAIQANVVMINILFWRERIIAISINIDEGIKIFFNLKSLSTFALSIPPVMYIKVHINIKEKISKFIWLAIEQVNKMKDIGMRVLSILVDLNIFPHLSIKY